jgi:hypothetical protein
MRTFLGGRPGPIAGIGVVLMVWGFLATYLVIAIAYGGFLSEPIIVEALVFGFTGGIFASGLALTIFGGYRTCRSLRSN